MGSAYSTVRRVPNANIFLVNYAEERLWWPIQSPKDGIRREKLRG